MLQASLFIVSRNRFSSYFQITFKEFDDGWFRLSNINKTFHSNLKQCLISSEENFDLSEVSSLHVSSVSTLVIN